MSHVTHMNESCYSYEWVMSHIGICWSWWNWWTQVILCATHIHQRYHILGKSTLQLSATHCNTLQHTATHCNTRNTHSSAMSHFGKEHTATQTPQHAATNHNNDKIWIQLSPTTTPKILKRWSSEKIWTFSDFLEQRACCSTDRTVKSKRWSHFIQKFSKVSAVVILYRASLQRRLSRISI